MRSRRSQAFCSQEVQDPGVGGRWGTTVSTLAMYLYTTVGGNTLPEEKLQNNLTKKLWKMLTLLLCSDWSELVLPDDFPSDLADYVYRAFEALNDLGADAPVTSMAS